MSKHLGEVDFATVTLIALFLCAMLGLNTEAFNPQLELVFKFVEHASAFGLLGRFLMRVLDLCEKYLDARTHRQ